MTEIMTQAADSSNALRNSLRPQLIFVQGKGGTGKTTVSRAIAAAFARQGLKTAWVEFDAPQDLKSPTLTQDGVSDFHLEAHAAFEEYVGLKLRMPKVASLFLKNSLIRTLARAAPGVHELVLIGKVWYERAHFQKIVVDMPSTGFGLTLFQATKNFAKILKGSLVEKDALGMLETFGDPELTSHIIVSLAEEMPLVEALELDRHIRRQFSKIVPFHIVNKIFPTPLTETPSSNVKDFAQARCNLEELNLHLMKDNFYQRVPYTPNPSGISSLFEFKVQNQSQVSS